MLRLFVKSFGLALLILLVGTHGLAQTTAGKVEFGAYSGAAFNLQGATAIACSSPSRCATSGGKTTHPMFGGQFGIAATPWLLLLADVSHAPLGEATASLSNVASTVKGSATTFHGLLEFQPKFRRIVPFGTIGWGAFHQGGSASLMGESQQVTGTKLSGQAGGGVRIFVSEQTALKFGFYGTSIKIGSGSSSENFASFGMFKAGMVFRAKPD